MIYRILIFYIGSLAILLSLYPWGKVVEGGSPFVLIFHALNSNLVATVLNIVVLTAALSVYNSCVYCNSRMLYGPAQQGNGPKSLLKVDGRGVPVVAIGISALATALCVLINYLIPPRLRTADGVGGIGAGDQLGDDQPGAPEVPRRQNREGVVPKFKAFWYPFSNYLCLLFMAGIPVIMYLTPGIQISVLLIPVWVAILAVGYAIKQRSQRVDGVTSR